MHIETVTIDFNDEKYSCNVEVDDEFNVTITYMDYPPFTVPSVNRSLKLAVSFASTDFRNKLESGEWK